MEPEIVQIILYFFIAYNQHPLSNDAAIKREKQL